MEADQQRRSPLDLIMNQFRRKASFAERRKPSVARLFRPPESNERKNGGITETKDTKETKETESNEEKENIITGTENREAEISSGAGWGRVKQFIQKLGKTPDAQSLNLGHSDLTATDVVELGTLLPFLAQLEVLDLSWNDLLGGSLKALTVNLQHVRRLKVLKLNGCRLTAQDLHALGEALESIPSLETLDLSWNAGIGAGNLHSLTTNLHVVSALKELGLVDCRLTEADAAALGHALLQLPCLEVLDLSSNKLLVSGVEGLAEALSSARRLKTLRLSTCGLDRPSVAVLGEKIAPLPGLERLDFSSNKDSGGALTSLAASLPLFRRLRSLDLHLCCLTEEDLLALVQAVPALTELEHLDLSCNRKVGGALHALLPALPLPKLKTLHLSGCDLGPEALRALGTVMPSLTRLESIDLSWNKCVGGDLGRLLEPLRAGSKLEELRLSSCDLTTEDVLHFESACRRGALRRLRLLDLSYNGRVGDAGWVSLLADTGGLAALQELDLGLRPGAPQRASPWLPAVAEALPRLPSLRRLALRRWALGPGEREALERSLGKMDAVLECDDAPKVAGSI